MKSYQYTCCRREADGALTVLDIKTTVVTAETPSDALNQLKQFFVDNACLPYREVT